VMEVPNFGEGIVKEGPDFGECGTEVKLGDKLGDKLGGGRDRNRFSILLKGGTTSC
jgi:hypothetical protein